MQGVKRNEVTLIPHDDSWTHEFERTKQEISTVLGDNVIEISHIGSTAIKGIVAKPILDVGVSVKNIDDINIQGMQSLGYEYCAEAGIPGRCYFVMRREDGVSTHHIHCYPEHHTNLIANILFRDFLNEHAEYASQYNDLKLQLSELYPNDRVKYTDGKGTFVQMICELAKAL